MKRIHKLRVEILQEHLGEAEEHLRKAWRELTRFRHELRSIDHESFEKTSKLMDKEPIINGLKEQYYDVIDKVVEKLNKEGED